MFDFSLDPFGKLDHDAKVNLITSVLPGFIEQGYSANDSLSIFQDNGLGINRQEFLGLYRNVLGIELDANRVKYVGGESVPSENILREAETPLPLKYRFVFSYDYIDTNTGKLESAFHGLDFNVLQSINDLKADAIDDIDERYPGFRDQITSITVVKGFKNA